MNDFLSELASRKWRYYQALYRRKPHVSTSDDCYERIKINAKYLEVLDIINDLPPQEQTIVNESYEELIKFFK